MGSLLLIISSLDALGDTLTDKDIFPYEQIPQFPVSTVEGHVGQMVFGYLDGIPVMCMQGRFHYYEGYPLAKVCAKKIKKVFEMKNNNFNP